nr:IS630 family transposase [Deinococcus peraridilitoris]
MSAKLQAEHPDKDVRLCFQDEARFGLKPTSRRLWAKKGQRPTAPSTVKYQWTYLYAVVEPALGRVFWFVLPKVDTCVMSVFLRAYAASLPEKVIALLVLDGAGWHSTRKLKVPDNIVLAVLPPYSPELNPAERLWTLVREATHHQTFTDLDALEQRLCTRCVELDAQPQVISSATAYLGYYPESS